MLTEVNSMSALRGETPENSLPCSSLFITSIIRQLAVYSRTEQHLEDVSGISNTENDEENALGNPLSRLPADALAKVKPLLLTLHCLFPNELLLALDILDRNLVIKYTVRSRTFRDERKHHIPQEEEHYGEEHYEDDGSGDVEVYCGDDPRQQHYMSNDDDYDDGGCHDNGIYFVRSLTSKAATLNTRRAGPGDEIRPFPHGENEYQVCLDAWNCTCPAFTLATFRDLSQGMNEPQLQAQGRESGITLKQKNWVFGGCLTQSTRCSSSSSSSSSSTGCCFMHDSPSICKHLLACVLASKCPDLFGSKVQEIYVDSREFAGKLAM